MEMNISEFLQNKKRVN